MLEAERIEPGALAAQIGTVQGAALPNLPIVVTPRDPRVAEARVVASPESQEVSDIILIPSGRLTLAELAAMFGSYEESPRLHPDRPRKLVFSPGRDSEHTFVVRIIAEVQAVGAQIGAADVERVLLTRARAAERTATPASAATSVGTTVWPRLLGQRASFGVRSWRAAALERVREEVERSLGVRFTASADKVYDGADAFECAMPACELRLNCWQATAGEDVFVFNLIGAPPEDLDGPPPERISESVAVHLRSDGHDWYVPDRLELLAEAGALDERQLDGDAIVAILGARWLAFSTPAQRSVGVGLLSSIVGVWLTAARRAPDPVAELTKQRHDLEAWGKGVDPERRVDILASYAVQIQLSVIEDELFEIEEQSRASGAPPPPSLNARLAELQGALPALREPAHRLGISSIARQYERVAATLQRLTSL